MVSPALLRGVAARSSRLAGVYGRPIAEASMNGAVTITRDSRPTWDPETQQATTGAGTLIYSGPANIETDQTSSQIVVGDSPTRISTMVAIIPISATLPEVDDILVVTATADPQLLTANNAFRVTSVSRGGVVPLSRRLVLESLEASSQHSLTLP